MPHNHRYYNVLKVLDEIDDKGSKQLKIELAFLYRSEPKLMHDFNHVNGFLDKSESHELMDESFWTDYITNTSELKLKAFQTIACHQKYLIDIEQEHLETLSTNLSNVDETDIDNWIEREICFGEKLRMKLVESLDCLAQVIRQIKNLQNVCFGSVYNATVQSIAMDREDEKNEFEDVLHHHLQSRFDECNKHLYGAEKELKNMADTWHRRHRARFLELSRLRPT
jgi:hypothetical protein